MDLKHTRGYKSIDSVRETVFLQFSLLLEVVIMNFPVTDYLVTENCKYVVLFYFISHCSLLELSSFSHSHTIDRSFVQIS